MQPPRGGVVPVRATSAAQSMAVAHASYLAASSVSTLDDVDRLSRDRSLGLSYEALLSILARRVDTDLKRDIGHHRKAEVAAQHVRKYLRGDSLLTIAASAGLPPTMLARVVLETHLNLKRGKEVGQLLKSPQLIDDARLRREVSGASIGPFAAQASTMRGGSPASSTSCCSRKSSCRSACPF